MRILAINVEIGLGHPNYLEYVLQALKQLNSKIELEYWDVLTHEKGFTKLFWQMSKKVYSFGAKGGFITDLYNKLRSSGKIPNLSICSVSKQGFDRIIVSHPLLAQRLSYVWYIHGEIALPNECILNNVEKIIVPTDYTRNKLIAQGIKSQQVLVTGLVIASDLIDNAKENYLRRLSRIESDKPLTIGFFVSGAYPPPHIKKLISGIIAITKENHRAIVFLGTNCNKANNFLNQLNQEYSDINKSKASMLFIQGRTRFDYQKRVNRLLPLFDAFVAPSHEHSNWALGLGMPIFVLFPMIGTYAEENFQFLCKNGVAYPLATLIDVQNLGHKISELRRSGKLRKMAENGFGKFSIDGAKTTALKILNL